MCIGNYQDYYTFLFCIWNGSTFVVTDNNNYSGGGDYYNDREFGSQASTAEYFISKTIIKDSTISCKIVKSNYYIKSASVPSVSGERVRLLSTNGDNTKVLCKAGSNPQRIFIYDIDYDTTAYDGSFINPIEVTNVPSDLGTNGGRNLLCASYEDGVSFVTTERYGPSGAYTFQLQSGYFDMENIEWHIKRQDNFGGYISRFIGSCDYKTVFFTASTAYDVTMEMSQVESGMEFNNNNWYRVNEIENVAVAGDVIKGKYVATDIGITKGTMPNNGALNYTPTTSTQTIPEGYTTGGTIGAVTSSIDSNIKANNIKSGVTILGVSGNSNVVDTRYTGSIPTNSDLVYGKRAWVNGTQIDGNVNSLPALYKNLTYAVDVSIGYGDVVVGGYTIPAKLIPNTSQTNFIAFYYMLGSRPVIQFLACNKNAEFRTSYNSKYYANYLTAYYKNSDTRAPYLSYYADNNFESGHIDTVNKVVLSWWKEYQDSYTGYNIGTNTYVSNHNVYYTGDTSFSTPIYSINYNPTTTNTLQVTDTQIKDVLLRSSSKYNVSVPFTDVANVIGLTANKIKQGETILGITGTYSGNVLLFETVTQMESYQNPTTNQLAVVYGTTYIGTYRYNGINWIQIGDSTENQQTMNTLNEVMNTPSDPYDGSGGTDQEIEDVLDDILGN